MPDRTPQPSEPQPLGHELGWISPQEREALYRRVGRLLDTDPYSPRTPDHGREPLEPGDDPAQPEGGHDATD